ncbi:AsmA-like C-terminal region-containing protein [Pacificimonas flava]|uniref:AsmA family protein n=1 Tax=Pacificimonas flava TaxID=1234595 RepID=UPI0030B8AE41
MDLTLDLEHSVLKLSPFKADLAGGRLTADIAIDAREQAVKTDYDISLSPTSMGKLLAHFGAEEAGTTGTLSGRIQLSGTGDSLRQSLAASSGRIALIMPSGTLMTGSAQLAELDIGTFVQKMFEDELKEPVEINCGLIAFTVQNGLAAADPILIDTKKNVILGRGGFSFRDERLDLAVRADAKTFSLFSGQSPVAVSGYFGQPSINPISGDLVGRAGAALGLAVVATPVAGLLAFVDPGDAKSAACAPILAGANSSAQKTSSGEPRDDVRDGTTAKNGRDRR